MRSAAQPGRTPSGSEPIRVLVAEDHALVRQAIVSLLGKLEGLAVVGTAGTGREAIDSHRLLRPDVTLMDLQMPDGSGLEAIDAIRGECQGAKIIVLTTYAGDERIRGAIERGAAGYLTKSCTSEELAEAIRQVHHAGTWLASGIAERLAVARESPRLTEREISVLRHASRGLKNKEIAALFGVSESAIKQVMIHVIRKLGAQDRTDATVIALRRGVFWIPEDG